MTSRAASGVRFLDLRVHDPEEREALLDAVAQVLDHGCLINGPEVDALEGEIASRCGTAHGVGVGSGTDALYLALRALGVGPGDEVITTVLSWVATANAIALTGARPVFCDVREDLNLDPEEIERRLSPRTKAILPVHFTGKLCDMERITAIAADAGVPIVEDAAQGFGAESGGKVAGSFGTLGCISLNPMKLFGAFGEAGIVVTQSEELRERLIALRYNGTVNRETCLEPSPNGRLDTLQAAMLLERLRRVESVIDRRRRNAERYDEALRDLVEVPRRSALGEHVYYTYTIQADSRDELRAHLAEDGIETTVQHPILMADQPAYENPADSDYACARALIDRILSIPSNEKITADEIDYVADSIRRFYEAS